MALLWLPLCLLCLELYARLELTLIGRNNPHVVEGRARLLGFAAALDDALWDVPFQSYKPSVTVEKQIGAHQFLFLTDAYGFRNEPVEVPKPDGVYRIVCVGGSTTVEGWTNASTYPGLLQAGLRDSLGTDRIEVVNCGISGHTSTSQVARFDDYLTYEPDLILEYNGVNDLWRSVERRETRLDGIRRLLSHSLFLRTRFSHRFVRTPEEARLQLERRTMSQHGKLADLADENGVRIAFATFARPSFETLGREERDFFLYDLHHTWPGQLLVPETYAEWIDLYNEEIRALSEQRNVPCLDIAPQIVGGADLFLDVCHMTPAGIEVKTKALLSSLLPLLREEPGTPWAGTVHGGRDRMDQESHGRKVH